MFFLTSCQIAHKFVGENKYVYVNIFHGICVNHNKYHEVKCEYDDCTVFWLAGCKYNSLWYRLDTMSIDGRNKLYQNIISYFPEHDTSAIHDIFNHPKGISSRYQLYIPSDQR